MKSNVYFKKSFNNFFGLSFKPKNVSFDDIR